MYILVPFLELVISSGIEGVVLQNIFVNEINNIDVFKFSSRKVSLCFLILNVTTLFSDLVYLNIKKVQRIYTKCLL